MPMNKLYLADEYGNKKEEISLGNLIAQGAAGTVYHVVNYPGVVIKIYKNKNNLKFYKNKISAMLAARPNLPDITYNGKNYVQIAWPKSLVIDDTSTFIGFMMPEVDITSSTELENILQKKARKNFGISDDYSLRVRLAANLSALISELHSLNHFMIDMKPINLRCYPDVQYMAILDTDGFSINGQIRYNADQFSDEYIAPEAKGLKPETLGEEQDLFALATIIFRLLNNGLHPYQGIDINQNHPSSLQERIFAGLYSYGVKPNPVVNPSKQSIHTFLEDDTRVLFDRSFQVSQSRPKASEWRDHLKDLIINNRLRSCKKNKDHGYFSKKCGFCELEKQNNQLSPVKIKNPTGSFKNKLAKNITQNQANPQFQTNIQANTSALSISSKLMFGKQTLAGLISNIRNRINPGFYIILIILFFGYFSSFNKSSEKIVVNKDYEKEFQVSNKKSPNVIDSGNDKSLLNNLQPRHDVESNNIPNSNILSNEVHHSESSSNIQAPAEQIWVVLYVNKKVLEAKKDSFNFQWIASPNTACSTNFPKDFVRIKNQPGLITGNFRLDGEKTINVRCEGSGQFTEQNMTIIVNNPIQPNPTTPTREIGSGTGGLY